MSARVRSLLRSGIAAGALVLLAALAGCGGSSGPVPKDAFYRLQAAPAPATAAATPRFPGVVEVRAPSTDSVLAQRPIAYVPAAAGGGAAPAVVEQYSYHFWTEPPALSVQQALAERLRATGLFQDVVTPDFRIPPAYEVNGRLARLEQRLAADGKSAVVVMELEAAVLRRQGMSLILHKVYAAEQPAADASVPAAVAAFQAALGRILDALAADLGTIPVQANGTAGQS